MDTKTTESGVTRRMLFADFAVLKFNPIIQWLRKDNVIGESVTTPQQFLEKITKESFDLVVVNLLLGGIGPFELIESVRKNSKNPDIKIIVVSRQVHKLNIQNTIRAGANDFLADPFDNENLYHRILYHLTPKHELEPSGWESSVADSKNWEYIKLMLESTESLSRTERDHEHETFLKTLQEIARLTGSNRTSLIIVDQEAESGLVLATSDDPAFQNFPLNLSKYPEIIHVVHSGHFVLVDDVAQSNLTQAINANVKSIKIGSIMVFPIRYQNEVMGVLVVRRRTANELPDMDIIRILQAVATTMAAHANLRVRLRKIYKDFSQKAG